MMKAVGEITEEKRIDGKCVLANPDMDEEHEVSQKTLLKGPPNSFPEAFLVSMNY